MVHSREEFFRIVDTLYAGVFDDETWQRALESIHSWFGAAGLSLFSVHPGSGAVHRADIVRLDPDVMAAYGNEWINHDPRYDAGKSLHDGEVVTEEHLVEWRQFVKTPIYNEFFQPSGIPRHMAAWVQRQQDRGVIISLQRSHVRGAYSDADRAQMSMLIPHIRRTVELKDRMLLAQLTAGGFVHGMDRLPLGVLLLDADLRIVRASQNAERLLAAGAGIKASRGMLEFVHPADRSRFAGWMREDPANTRQGDVMRVSRGAGMSPLSLSLLPLPAVTQTWLAPAACWMVLIHAPEMCTQVPVERIRLTLGITAAEARLVQQLLDGLPLTDAAGKLGISAHTARTQLKSVYAKTGLTGQAQLVRVLLSNPLIGVRA